MTIELPPRNIRELQDLLEEWPEGKRSATVRGVLVLAGSLHHVAYVKRSGKCFVRRLLRLSKPHLNGQEKWEAGGGGVG